MGLGQRPWRRTAWALASLHINAQRRARNRTASLHALATEQALFLQETALQALPSSLQSCRRLRRVNIEGVGCDDRLAAALERLVSHPRMAMGAYAQLI